MTDDTRTKRDLLPCPFCGCSASIERIGDRRKSTVYQCDECGCSLETGEEWGHGTAWNRRAILDAPPAQPVAVEGAPERVWLDADAEAGEGKFPRCFENPKYCNEPPIEYIRADLAHPSAAPTDNTALVEALHDARMQLSYLNEKQSRGTTNAIIARIDAALASREAAARKEGGA